MKRAIGVSVVWGISCLVLNGCGGGGSNSISPPPNNPTPSISGIAPNTVTAGAGDTSVTIDGSGFIASSAVKWNAAALSTTFVSSTKLTAVVPATQLSGSSTDQITVVNPTPGGGTSGATPFTVNSPVASITDIWPRSVPPGAPET